MSSSQNTALKASQNATMDERQDGVLERENILGEIKSSYHEQSTMLQSNRTGFYSLISQQEQVERLQRIQSLSE